MNDELPKQHGMLRQDVFRYAIIPNSDLAKGEPVGRISITCACGLVIDGDLLEDGENTAKAEWLLHRNAYRQSNW